MFYAKSPLAIVFLISEAQSSIKSGELHLRDFSMGIESERVFMQILFRAQVQKV